MSDTLNIIIVEDQTLVRDALAQLLNLQSDINVQASLKDGLEAQAFLQENTVDLVLSDIEMPGMDGLKLCEWITQHQPTSKVIIVTTYNRSGYLTRAVKAGASGFVLKEVAVDELAEKIRKVAAGQKVFDSELVLAGLQEQDPLTEREREALRLAEQGLSSAAIAEKMCLSEGTIRNYLSECMSKLYAHSRIEAARTAREKGWL